MLDLCDDIQKMSKPASNAPYSDESAYRLFFELIYARDGSGRDVRAAGSACGIDVSGCGFISEIGIGVADADETALQKLRNTVVGRMSEGGRIVSVVRSDRVLCWVAIEANDDKRGRVDTLVRSMGSFSSSHDGINVFAGIGGTFHCAAEASESFFEASAACKLARHSSCSISVYDYDDLGFLRLFAEPYSDDTVRAYCQRLLKPLSDRDKNSRSSYIDTLNAYLDNNCNLIKTAAVLMIHRNTLIYRIERIKEITGRDITYDAHAKNEYMNALRLAGYYDMEDLLPANFGKTKDR